MPSARLPPKRSSRKQICSGKGVILGKGIDASRSAVLRCYADPIELPEELKVGPVEDAKSFQSSESQGFLASRNHGIRRLGILSVSAVTHYNLPRWSP